MARWLPKCAKMDMVPTLTERQSRQAECERSDRSAMWRGPPPYSWESVRLEEIANVKHSQHRVHLLTVIFVISREDNSINDQGQERGTKKWTA